MKRELQMEPEFLDTLPENCTGGERVNGIAKPEILDVAALLALTVPAPSMLVENMISSSGASLMFGAPKSNKTLAAVQIGISVAANNAVFDYYNVIEPGPVLMVEQDDPPALRASRRFSSGHLYPLPVFRS